MRTTTTTATTTEDNILTVRTIIL